MNDESSHNRIDALKTRERELRAKIAAEQIRLARRRQKEDAQVFALVGRALVENAAQSPNFQLMLKQTLGIAVTDERSRKLLASRGLI